MKILKLSFILILIISCSKTAKQEETNVKKDTVESGVKPISPESENDSKLYINKIDYFPSTNEFYVSLIIRNPINDNTFEALIEKTDSTIYSDDETSRKRLPPNLAKEVFDLRQLDELKVFNSDHQFITDVKFKRVEYLDELNGSFIGVFAPKNKIDKKDPYFYCIGKKVVALRPIKNQLIEDKGLDEKIKTELKIIPKYISRIAHIKIQPNNSIYSIYAYIDLNGKAISYLTEYKNNKLQVLHKLEDEVAFDGFMPTAVEINGKPVFLIHIILPDSDAVDDYAVATFNNSAYILEKDYLISLK